MDFEFMYLGFESRESHDFILLFFFFFMFFVIIITVKIANLTLLSLLRFSYFITPYDAQASSALIFAIQVTAAILNSRPDPVLQF